MTKNEEAFLIPRLFATKKGHIASTDKGISYTRTREIFMEFIKPVSKRNLNLGLHSCRSGGASAAAENEVSERLISKHGRWNTTKARDGYIKDSVSKRLKITKSLGL